MRKLTYAIFDLNQLAIEAVHPVFDVFMCGATNANPDAPPERIPEHRY